MKEQLFLIGCLVVAASETEAGSMEKILRQLGTLWRPNGRTENGRTSIRSTTQSSTSSPSPTSLRSTPLSRSSFSAPTSVSTSLPLSATAISSSVTSPLNVSSPASTGTSRDRDTMQQTGTNGEKSTGTIAGIVVGVIVGVILIAAVIFLVLWLTRRKRPTSHQESKPVPATVVNDYDECPPLQRPTSEHQYAIIDETDTGSTNGGFMTSQYESVYTSQTDNHVSGISNEAMTSATDSPVDSNSRGSTSEVTLVENATYG